MYSLQVNNVIAIAKFLTIIVNDFALTIGESLERKFWKFVMKKR